MTTTLTKEAKAVEQFIRTLPPPARQGKFIVIDGPDYCGKGTQHRMLIDYMLNHPLDRERKLINVFATREPFSSSYAQEVRDLLRHSKDVNVDPAAFAKAFTLDRRIHMNVARVLLASGVDVIQDRYKYSTFAYQGLQGVPEEKLLEMHEGLPVPDLTLFVMTSLERRMQRKAADRERPYDEVFEKDKGFQGALQDKYLKLKKLFANEPIVLIDGDRERHEIQNDIREHVDKLLFP